MINSIFNYLGGSYAQYPQLPTTNMTTGIDEIEDGSKIRTLGERVSPELEKELNLFFSKHNYQIKYKDGSIVSSNEDIFGYLVGDHKSYHLAKAFFIENPDVNTTAPAQWGSILIDLVASVTFTCADNPDPDLERIAIARELLELILKDGVVDLFYRENYYGLADASYPEDYLRSLDVLIDTNEVGLLNTYMEKNLLKDVGACNTDEKTKDNILLAREIFCEIKESQNKKLANLPYDLNADSELWKNYLFLLKSKYPDVFYDLDSEKTDIERTVEAMTIVAEKFFMPEEIWQHIGLLAFLDNTSPLSELPNNLINSVFSISLEQRINPKIIKCASLCFQAYAKKNDKPLDNDQKRMCYRLIKKAFLKYDRPFDAEIKQKIVNEIGAIENFNKAKIRRALENAFN